MRMDTKATPLTRPVLGVRRVLARPCFATRLARRPCLPNDTAVQRRAHGGATRPRRPSDCDGWLAAAPRLECFRHAPGEIFVVLTKGADERRLKVEVGDEALREVADATFPV
jgi:hypothetical protein